MTTHYSILALRIQWTEDPGGLQSMGLQRVRHDWVTNTFISYTSIICSHPVVHYIPSPCLFITLTSLYLLTIFLQVLLALLSVSGTTSLISLSRSLAFCFVFRFHILVRSYSICLSLPDLFHLALCFQNPPMLSQMVGFCWFLWLNNIPLCVYVYTLFIHSSFSRHVDCFHVLAIINSAAMNMRMQTLVQVSVLEVFGYAFRTGIAGPCGSSPFNFLENYIRYCFPQWLLPVYSVTNGAQGFLFSISTLAFVIFCLLIMAILTGMRWYLIVILICISLVASDVEHLFMYLLTIHISSLERCLFKFFAHFLFKFLFFFFCSWVLWILYIF